MTRRACVTSIAVSMFALAATAALLHAQSFDVKVGQWEYTQRNEDRGERACEDAAGDAGADRGIDEEQRDEPKLSHGQRSAGTQPREHG